MTIIQKSITVNAPVSQIQSLLDDAHKTTEWYAGMEAIKPEAGYPVEVGSQATITIKAGGMSLDSDLKVTQNEPGKVRQFAMEGMITGTNTWSFREDGNVTHIDLLIDYEMSGGGLGKLMDKLFVERMNDKNAATSLGNLKKLVEG